MIRVESGVFGILQNNCYLLTEEESGESALVDCAVYDERMQAFVRGRNLKYLLLTHGHFDHIGGAAALRAATGARVIVQGADAPMLASGTKNLGAYFRIPCDAVPCDGTVHGGDILRLGKTPITVIETPGHSPGSCCYLCENALFSGDTLMCRSIGRTDFPGGDKAAMESSLAKLRVLGKGVKEPILVYPGHGDRTTLAAELLENPYFSRHA